MAELTENGPPSYGEVNHAYQETEHNGNIHTNSTLTRRPRDENNDVTAGDKQWDKEKDGSQAVTIENDGSASKLLYRTSQTPPFHLLLFFGFQQALLSLSSSLGQVIIAAGVMCADNDQEMKSQMLGSILIINGLSTLMMVTLGSRLPLYQGSYSGYLIPLLTLQNLQPDMCKRFDTSLINATAANSSLITDIETERKQYSMDTFGSMQGSLMLVGFIHALIGGTGLIGVLLRFIGPVTIVPTILLVGIYIAEPALKFAVVYWPITFLTLALAFIFAFYLGKFLLPIPVWTPSKGFRFIRYPLHQVYAILIAITIGWLVCHVMTVAGVFTDDPKNKQYKARTDASIHEALDSANWIFYPYPGMYGTPTIKATIFVGYMIATMISILDSIGDYYACARMSHVPPPPQHATNRGIMVEGISTVISGAMGAPVATTTYGPNIGAIGITRVASRSVFITLGLIYIVFGLLGKLSAVFVSIPHPVLGGSIIMMVGMFIGVNLSNLQPVDLSSTRNLAIIGVSIMMGLVVPLWVKKYPEDVETGNVDIDFILKGLLANPNFSGSVLAFLLDNTIPGTKKERGISAWQDPSSCSEEEKALFEDTAEIYEFPLSQRIKRLRIWKYIPFMPDPAENEENQTKL
ncbi:hypothetical protein FSP39_000293 [Pinctada imbricata]|uniref:Solute carrier family 23 member 2 n=1 Tax=Pinctada imbricata TaxID=66713 RepID=A0AA89C7P4_PINIB|nr:hypothetical protein FSP39_000293 [Pinctada imbricata]